MRSDVIVITSVGSQEAAQVCLAEDNKMINTLAPAMNRPSRGGVTVIEEKMSQLRDFCRVGSMPPMGAA
jgi:hypothetical protein